jgi:dipeptidyl aminopeptidase/acylaminoacyl peptidase
VLNVNFRGSPGFGKAFLDAERLEWGGKMNLDLVDQAGWAARRGISDPHRIAIMGGSYGGYATLCAMTLTPGVFACGIDVVGPANLETFIANMPKTWSLDHLARRIGDPRTPEGLAHLRARSPIHFVDRIHEPMLIAQGANDSRVAQSESDSMAAELDRHGVRVTYLLYPDEGHGFLRPGNSAAFYAVTEAFLAANLGGRCEPLADQLDDSSVLVPVGATRVPGLEEALRHREHSPR